MKKAVLTVTALGFTLLSMAQDKFVTSALTALSQKSFDEAKTDIDKAMASPETREKPKALLAKAQIYFSMQQIEKYKTSNPYREGTQALLKLVEVKPEYEKEDVNPILFYGACMYYNDGTLAYNDKKYTEATEFLKQTVKIQGLGGGKRFDKFQLVKNLDTVSANANLTIARIAYYENRYEDAIAMLTKVKNSPITKNADSYIILLDCYEKYNVKNGNKLLNDELAIIQEARTAYPNDVNLRNKEMNRFIDLGKINELSKKMEEAIEKEPNNADMHFNMALLYQGMANPKEGGKPANAAELYTKSEAEFDKALKLSPESGSYNYNFGALYFMQAYEMNEKMNAITGTTAPEMKKYEELKAKRDGFFNKSQPYLEKANSLFASKEKDLSENEKETYFGSLTALKQIYGAQNKTEQMKEVNTKLKAMSGK